MDALYTVKLAYPEYKGVLEDVIRMVIIQITIQFLYYVNNGVPFFSVDFFLLVLYIILGVAVYWLVFKKLVVLV